MKKKIIPDDLFSRSIAFKDNRRLQKLVLVVALFVTIYFVLVIFSIPARFDLTVGRPSSRTIYAPRDVVDEYSTLQLQEQAAQQVPEAFDYDPLVLEKALREIGLFFDKVIEIQENPELEKADQLEALQSIIPEEMPLSTISALLTDTSTIRDLQGRLNTSVSEIFEQGIKENEEDLVRRRLNQEIALYPFNADLKRIAEVVLKPLVEQNMTLNSQLTEENREQARRQIEPVIVLRNTLIISEGEPVTEQ
jgi:cyclic-di-AMP phosphodiesterase PgpH